MIGSASNNQFGLRFDRRACPTRSHLCVAGGTAKMRADWASVSGVSGVSPYPQLIEDYREEQRTKARQALIGAMPLALRQVGHSQSPRAFVVRQHGRDIGEPSETTRKTLGRAVKV